MCPMAFSNYMQAPVPFIIGECVSGEGRMCGRGCTYIPMCPMAFSNYMQAPVPFIIGECEWGGEGVSWQCTYSTYVPPVFSLL